MKQNYLNSLQLQLQEHFFRSHPPYLKQLCDISAERLVFRSLVPGLFLVERENEPGYKAKCFLCVMMVGVGLRVRLREKNVVSN